MYTSVKPFTLASASPRRQAFLSDLGISFEIHAADIDETPLDGEAPLHYASRMAREKCLAVAAANPARWVLAADTVVHDRSVILGKPADKLEAASHLLHLSGRTHKVTTAFTLSSIEGRVEFSDSVTTSVTFDILAPAVVQAYVNTGEPMDKAGGYGIQGRGGGLVKAIEGSYTNVVGLPLAEVLSVLIKYGIVKTK